MKIFIDKRGITQKHIEEIKSKFLNVEFITEVEKSYDSIAMLAYPDYIVKENIDKYPNLKWIQVYTAGFNTIDLDYLREKNILLTNGKDVYSKTIAEDVFTKVLSINRNVRFYFDNMKTGTWKQMKNEVELTGSTVGIIGTGSIGKEIAKRFKSFETKVIGHKRTKEAVEYFDEIYTGSDGLNELIKISDYIILALPLNDESLNLMNKDKFKLMKNSAVLVNIARGEVVNQDDLIYALENKMIRACALDVTVPEPLPKDSKLWSFDNVFITPHNAMSSPLLQNRLTNLLIENLNNYINKREILNLVKE